MRLATASDISDTGCGNGKVQSSLPPGRGAGAKASCTVWVSVATGAMASTAGTGRAQQHIDLALGDEAARVLHGTNGVGSIVEHDELDPLTGNTLGPEVK